MPQGAGGGQSGPDATAGVGPITQHAPQDTVFAPFWQPRARGQVRLSARATPRGSVIDGLRQSGALRLLFPRCAGGGALDAILVNTAGGITGGDRFETCCEAGAGSHLRLTTQAAERIYRARPGESGRVATRLVAGPGARLDWLPQETILFDGAALQRRLIVDLAADARLLLVEPLVFGRQAMGERLHAASFADRVELRRAGRLVYLDARALSGDIAARLAGPATAGGAGAMASLLYVAPEAEAQLVPLRALLPRGGGVSLLDDDVLVLRLLAADAFALRQTLLPVLARLTADSLPRSWMT